MKVKALQTCYINSTYRKGPESDSNDQLVGEGEIFDVPDGTPINPEILEVLDSPEQKSAAPAKAPPARKA